MLKLWQLRAVLCAALTIAGAGFAHAAQPGQDRDEANSTSRRLACLQASPPATIEAAPTADGAPRLLRVRLIFRGGEAEPTVEWLWKADEAVVARLTPHLLSYRMACLSAGEAPQAVVQEFWLHPTSGRLEAGKIVASLLPGPQTNSCYQPYGPDILVSERPSRLAKVLVRFRFPEGGGEPDVEIVHNIGSPMFALDVRRHVRRAQRCADGRTEAGTWHQQLFEYVPRDQKLPQFKSLDLVTFLGQVNGAKELKGHFDTRTMNCPFEVKWTLYQPAKANEAISVGGVDPNRTAFHDWLSQLQLDLPKATEEQMFGRDLTIKVPCLLLDFSS
ncbi:MAG: hypothetical protein EOP39_09650 [Rubrivivax sp.]|nr:MAG: hypothetical protein EOP39_09650 [Rubrivivax sp.]